MNRPVLIRIILMISQNGGKLFASRSERDSPKGAGEHKDTSGRVSRKPAVPTAPVKTASGPAEARGHLAEGQGSKRLAGRSPGGPRGLDAIGRAELWRCTHGGGGGVDGGGGALDCQTAVVRIYEGPRTRPAGREMRFRAL